MYNNPYLNNQFNINNIDKQISDLQALKERYQNMPQYQGQQPIQNIINTGTPSQIDFEARYLKENEEVDNLLVQRKTAFIDLKKGQLKVKDIDGTIVSYDFIVPKDEKDIKIEEQDVKIKELEAKLNEFINNTTISQSKGQKGNVGELDKK